MSLARGFAFLGTLTVSAAALAAPALAGAPEPWQLGFQEAATPTMEMLHEFHNWLLVIITAISVFVLALLIYVMVRFNERRNPVPSRTSHHTVIEVIWTVVPVLILVGIAIPSFKILYFTDHVENADMTIKAVGHQWYWSYEYPDNGNFTFDAFPVAEEDLGPGQLRLLETDNRVVVPVDTNIRVLVTGSDVLHSWAIPGFGVKKDAVPGRLNETWFRVTKEGVYYGQCSELCGVGHAYMPIAVEAVSKEEFAQWVAEAQQNFARVDGPTTTVAQTQSAN
ncbi:cytochrome c oxidase subunit II [Rhodospirillaceae bacterium SYSU D60014]|uniref:cytochrome c oxidase subunit II n=1 Tax=Virgifigura deserti TaxID=2268457 RepID=UPI000E66A7B6